MLGHSTTTKLENYYEILKSGYLKSGMVTGKRRFGDYFSKYIFLMLLKPRCKSPMHLHFKLDVNLLLDNSFYIRSGWNGQNLHKSDIKINGKKLNKKELKSMLKDIDDNREILVTKQIDLKYLKYITIMPNMKKDDRYKEFVHYVKTEYPNVKLIPYK